jgi:hypothetical protein
MSPPPPPLQHTTDLVLLRHCATALRRLSVELAARNPRWVKRVAAQLLGLSVLLESTEMSRDAAAEEKRRQRSAASEKPS